jgi:hypothetical protein
MATVVKNTNIPELLQVSAGNFEVFKKMNEEFRQLAQAPLKKVATPASASSESATAAASTAGKP